MASRHLRVYRFDAPPGGFMKSVSGLFQTSRALIRGASALFLAFAGIHPVSSFEIESRGELGYRFYITQDSRYRDLDNRKRELFPGHRLVYSLDNAFPLTDRNQVLLDVSVQTLLARLNGEFVKMDKAHYRIAPGLRHTFGSHTGSFMLSHESIHNVDRLSSPGGSIFWTLAYLELASRRMDPRVLRASAARPEEDRSSTPWGALDYRLGAGMYVPGDSTYLINQRNDLRSHAQVALRYSLPPGSHPSLFTDWTQELWTSEARGPQYKGTVRLSWIVPTRGSAVIVHAGHTYLDQHHFNNEHSLWSAGLSILH
jgi:hypothetical protein